MTADPFPDRITTGHPEAARTLRAHAASAALDAERALARLDAAPDDPTPVQLTRQREAARRYVRATSERRAFSTLADLHERRGVPSPLLAVRTRRHVRTLLGTETFGPDADRALRTALRWTLGLPMRRRTGFGVMRACLDRLGLLGPAPLPLAVAQALSDAPAASVLTAPAPPPVAAPPAETPHTAETYAQAVRALAARSAPAWVWHVTQARSIDAARAFGLGLSPDAAATVVADWLVGIVAHGHRPLDWRRPPYARDDAGRLRPTATENGGGERPGPLALAA